MDHPFRCDCLLPLATACHSRHTMGSFFTAYPALTRKQTWIFVISECRAWPDSCCFFSLCCTYLIGAVAQRPWCDQCSLRSVGYFTIIDCLTLYLCRTYLSPAGTPFWEWPGHLRNQNLIQRRETAKRHFASQWRTLTVRLIVTTLVTGETG